jgi:hypothetical protein
MAPMGWLARLFRGIDTGTGLRPGSGASVLYLFLFLAFGLVGAILLLLGFDLDAVDRWLDARAGWFDAIGALVFQALLAAVLLICTVTVGAGLYERFRPSPRSGRSFGWGAMIGALVVGYFCWVGLSAPL